MFDYAERQKPKPLLPTFPEDDHSWHFFIGADGTKVHYYREAMNAACPWRVEGEMWMSPTYFAQALAEALPLTEIGVEDTKS